MPTTGEIVSYVIAVLDTLGITQVLAALVIIAGAVAILRWVGVLKD